MVFNSFFISQYCIDNTYDYGFDKVLYLRFDLHNNRITIVNNWPYKDTSYNTCMLTFNYLTDEVG